MKLTTEHLVSILEGDLAADDHWKWHIEVVREKSRIFIEEARSRKHGNWDPRLIDELIDPDSPIFYINPQTLPPQVPQRFRDEFMLMAGILSRIAGSTELLMDSYHELNEHLARLAGGHYLHSLACRTIVTLQPEVFAMIMLDDLYGADGLFTLIERHVADPHRPHAAVPADRHRNWYGDNHALLLWMRQVWGPQHYVTAYATHLLYVLRLFDQDNDKFMDRYAHCIRGDGQVRH